jgi:hypothetical protein
MPDWLLRRIRLCHVLTPCLSGFPTVSAEEKGPAIPQLSLCLFCPHLQLPNILGNKFHFGKFYGIIA